MPRLLLALGVGGLLLAINLWRPRRWPAALAIMSFFAGWLTGELALHSVIFQAAIATGLLLHGALSGWEGWLGLGLSLGAWTALLAAHRRGFGAAAAVEDALRSALGDDWDDALLLPARPPIDWRRVLLPFPIRHPAVARHHGVEFCRHGQQVLHLDVHRRRDAPTGCPTLVYVHGGAWIFGHRATQGLPLLQHMAALGWVCFSVDYRLSPRATFPDQLVDVKRAIAWVRAHGAEHGADPSFILLAGNSAGGHLAALAALTPNDPVYQPGFEEADTSVDGCIPFYGIYDFADRFGHWPNRGLKWLLEHVVMKARHDRAREAWEAASPIARIHADAPPFLILHGTNDTLVPVEEARRFEAALRAISSAPVAYAELDGAQHAFEVFPSVRALGTIPAVARFAAWLHARWQARHHDAPPKKTGAAA